MRLAALIAALGLLAVSPAWAQDDEEGPAMITAMWTHDCDGVEPTALTFDQAMTLPRDQIPKCVVVEGLWSFRTLHRDLAARYARGPDWDEPSLSWFGIYQQPEAPEPDAPVPARLIGKVGDCDDIRPDIWMGGYCHYRPGRILILGRTEVLGPTPERWTGAEVRTQLGSLIEPSADWPHRAYVESIAAEWLMLVRSGDAAAYYARFHPDRGIDLDVELADPDSNLYALFVAPGSVFARLRETAEPASRIWRLPAEDEYPGNAYALVCYALDAWSDDRWPVAYIDADNSSNRPYVCLGVSRELGERSDVHEWIDDDSSPMRGLAEPAW